MFILPSVPFWVSALANIFILYVLWILTFATVGKIFRERYINRKTNVKTAYRALWVSSFTFYMFVAYVAVFIAGLIHPWVAIGVGILAALFLYAAMAQASSEARQSMIIAERQRLDSEELSH